MDIQVIHVSAEQFAPKHAKSHVTYQGTITEEQLKRMYYSTKRSRRFVQRNRDILERAAYAAALCAIVVLSFTAGVLVAS